MRPQETVARSYTARIIGALRRVAVIAIKLSNLSHFQRGHNWDLENRRRSDVCFALEFQSAVWWLRASGSYSELNEPKLVELRRLPVIITLFIHDMIWSKLLRLLLQSEQSSEFIIFVMLAAGWKFLGRFMLHSNKLSDAYTLSYNCLQEMHKLSLLLQ